MRRLVLLAIAIAVVLPAAAEELSVDGVISAYRLGAPVERILAQVNDPASSVPPMLAADVARLRAAGVPEEVVQALLARAPLVQPTPPPTTPDNPQLVELVRLVGSGLSEKIIADQIVQSGVSTKPSINDLIYLKEHEVPEMIIVALMDAPVAGSAPAPGAVLQAAGPSAVRPVAPPAPATPESDAEPEEIELEGLVYRTGMFAKNRVGKLLLEDDKLMWRDARDASANFEMYLNGVRQVTVECLPRDAEPFCYRLEFDFAKGDDYAFEDADRDVGGNEHLLALLEMIEERYPDVSVVEKVKK